ncbi:MAG: T9SS type A sorting domain-containing protein [Bacteroidota bacterium]
MRLAILCLFLPLYLPTVAQSLPWPAESPVQDSYGYRWETNTAPTAAQFQWVAIEGLGEQIELSDDNTAGPFSLGMHFPYYWQTYDHLWIGANGYVSFGSGIPISATASGFPLLPNPLQPNHVIAPFLTDLTGAGTNNSGSVWMYKDSLNHRFIVSWIDWPYAMTQPPFHAGSNSFQLILNGADSSILFQYLSMNGNWDPSYDQSLYPFVVGIENQSGNMGLMPTGLPISRQLLPVDSTAIRFIRPVMPRIPIPDLSIRWTDNPQNMGIFLPWSPPDDPFWRPAHLLDAYVQNTGIEDIQQQIEIRSWIKNAEGNVVFSRTKQLPSLSKGEERYLQYYDHFDPPHAGTYMQQTFVVQSNAYGDLNMTNDSMGIELVVLDSSQSEHRLSFEQTDNTSPLFLYEGNSAAVWFEPYGYPVFVRSLEYNMFLSAGSTPQSGFFARIYAFDQDHIVGPLLFEQFIPVTEVVLPTGWTEVILPDPIRIDHDGFLVSWETVDPSLHLLTDRMPPFSRRSYEQIDTLWRPAISAYKEDLMIRAVVDHASSIPSVGIQETVPFLVEMQVFPNPVGDMLHVQAHLPSVQSVELRLVDLLGQTVASLALSPRQTIDWRVNVADIAAGLYLVQLRSSAQLRTQKVVIQP